MNSLQHIAIIMDGNDRWATARGLSTKDGHKAGAENAFNIIEKSIRQGVKHLSLFAFSSENLNRPKNEVENFMSLLNYYVDNDENRLHEHKVRVKFIGDLNKLNALLRAKLLKLEKSTAAHENLNLYIMIAYGGRWEIINAAQKILNDNITPQLLNETNFHNYLCDPTMPEVDLLIRTGDKLRISNFLLWHTAYAELFFSKKMWPDFKGDDLKEAISEYNQRTRTFGVRDV